MGILLTLAIIFGALLVLGFMTFAVGGMIGVVFDNESIFICAIVGWAFSAVGGLGLLVVAIIWIVGIIQGAIA